MLPPKTMEIKAYSRREFKLDRVDDTPSRELINTGAFLRIALALEKLAAEFTALMGEHARIQALYYKQKEVSKHRLKEIDRLTTENLKLKKELDKSNKK